MSKKIAAKCLNILTWIFLGYGVLHFGLVPGIVFDNLDSTALIIRISTGFSLALICKLIAEKLEEGRP